MRRPMIKVFVLTFREYKDALESVDTIVKKTEKMVNDYYGDNDTLFIFTSDHGMTDWGRFLKCFTLYGIFYLHVCII